MKIRKCEFLIETSIRNFNKAIRSVFGEIWTCPVNRQLFPKHFKKFDKLIYKLFKSTLKNFTKHWLSCHKGVASGIAGKESEEGGHPLSFHKNFISFASKFSKTKAALKFSAKLNNRNRTLLWRMINLSFDSSVKMNSSSYILPNFFHFPVNLPDKTIILAACLVLKKDRKLLQIFLQ